MADRDGGPAFPVDTPNQFPTQPGMSLRDYFAGQALAGWMANPNTITAMQSIASGREDLNLERMAALAAYYAADAMLAAREATHG